MNISFNQRYQFTEEKIQKALFSLLRIRKYNDISIKEICFEAGINRSSFYAHYSDINDLMIKVEQNLSKNMLQIFSPQTEWKQEVFEKMFEFLYKNQNFYRAYLLNNDQTFMEKNDFSNFVKIVCCKQSHYQQDEIIYHMAFFAGGIKAMSKSWLQTGCKQTPLQMAKILTDEYKKNAKFFC